MLHSAIFKANVKSIAKLIFQIAHSFMQNYWGFLVFRGQRILYSVYMLCSNLLIFTKHFIKWVHLQVGRRLFTTPCGIRVNDHREDAPLFI